MAISNNGDISLGLTIDKSGQNLKRLLVFFCQDGEGLTELRKHKLFPALGDAHPELSAFRASSIRTTPACDGRKNKYEVEVSYTAASAATSSGTVYNQPFDLTLSTIEKVVPFEFSYDLMDDANRPLRPVVTTAGTAISANTIQTSLLLRFSYNLRSFNPRWILEVADTVNKNPVKVCGLDIPAECGLIKTVAAEIVQEDGNSLNSIFRVDVAMEIAPDGFIRTFPNRSVCYRGANGNPVLIYTAVDSLGNPVFGSPNRLCPLFCHPTVFSGLLSASGSGSRPKPLQNNDIQSVSLFLRRTGNKKGASEKGSFVRIKGLEPPRREASDPKSDVSTNSTIPAWMGQRYE